MLNITAQFYVRKNYKIKCSEKHQHDDNQIATKTFCLKADYAESTGTHNTQNANLIHTLYTEKIPAQEDDNRCRTTIYGYPIVIFHQTDENSTPEFIGKYNFNYDKNSLEVFGFTDSYDVESWEFLNNTSDDCNFLSPLSDNWSENFEARYPEDYTDISRFRITHDWVVSTRQDTATGETLSESYTDIDGNIHTVDNAEYRLAKFKTEFENYFDLHYSLIYYVYTFIALMVDQRAKNLFLTYWGNTGKFYPYFYDNDTSFGINNEGLLVFDYYLEDTDTLDGENVYNGQNSVLWTNFRQSFADEIKETYQDLRNNKKITIDKFINYFIINGSDKWSASIYNEDSEFKYISMLKSDNNASNLYQVRGTGEEHFKYFIENRLNYCDSKWYASDYANNIISLRIYTPSTWTGVEPNANITITPFSNMYAGVRYKANGVLQQIRATKNTPVTFTAPTDEDFIDTETAVYGASEISSLGDLAPLYCGTIDVSKANKLVELKIGDGTEGYSNSNLKTLSVGTNKLLKKIDVRNCPNLVDSLGLSECPNIEEIYATGSGITGIELSNTGCLKIIQLPSTLTNLTLKNQLYIEQLTLEGYESIKTLCIENCPTVDTINLLNNCTNLERVRLTNVNWSFDDTTFLYELRDKNLHGIDENNINTDNAWIDGTCHITSLTGNEVSELNSLYPYLKITYDNLTTQLIFMSEDGTTELTRQTINNGGDGTDPVSAGTITVPTKDSTAQYSYTFAGWSLTSGGSIVVTALKNVVADRYVYAAFNSIVRTYTVYFYNDSTLLQTSKNIAYGSSASYTGDTPVKTGTNIISEDWEFIGWNPSPTNIIGETKCYALYKYIGYVYTELVERTLSGEYTNDTITEVGSYAFYGCTNLTSVVFKNVETVGSDSFQGCTSLSNISMQKATNIGGSAFYGCTNLAIDSLPENLTTIGQYAFYNCTNLALTSLPKGVTVIEAHAFQFCKNLTLTLLPNGITSIGSNAFRGCTNLALTSLPDGVATIDESAFEGCTNLALTSLPESIISISGYVFYNCTNLTTITFKGTPTSIDSSAFSRCANLTTINVPWAEGAVANAPWGATNATINYNYTGE